MKRWKYGLLPAVCCLSWIALGATAVIDYEIEYQKTAKNAGEDCGCSVKLDLPGAPKAATPPVAPLNSSKKK